MNGDLSSSGEREITDIENVNLGIMLSKDMKRILSLI